MQKQKHMSGDRNFQGDLDGFGAEYEIIGELGRGGISVVYLARDRELDREVAIKVIRDQFLDDTEANARFEREARTLARLQHPNIVAIHTAKRFSNGNLALVMQLTQGCTLREVLRREGPFSFERAGQVLKDVAGALDYLHGHGIVHRDIKPENIFLDEASGRVLLSDFGIAKSHDGMANLTLAGAVIGTPTYMSPEQTEGAVLDGRSDLYSLGLVGHELLSGTQPWAGENLYSIIYKQKNEELPPLESIRPDIPRYLRVAIERALAKDRERRWASAREFLEQLNGGTPREPYTEKPDKGIIPLPDSPVPARASEEMATIRYVRPEIETAAPAPPVKTRRTRYIAAAVAVLILGGGMALVPLIGTKARATEDSALAQPPGAEVTVREAGVFGAPVDLPEEEPFDTAGSIPTQPEVSDADGEAISAAAIEELQRRIRELERRAAPVTPAPKANAAENPALTVLGDEFFAGIEPRVRGTGIGSPKLEIRTIESTLPESPSGADAPGMTAPELLNHDDVVRAMDAAYPPRLKRSGIGGIVRVSLLIGGTGEVIESRVATSSGREPLDAAALKVARQMTFTPPRQFGEPTRMWVDIPLIFQSRAGRE